MLIFQEHNNSLLLVIDRTATSARGLLGKSFYIPYNFVDSDLSVIISGESVAERFLSVSTTEAKCMRFQF